MAGRAVLSRLWEARDGDVHEVSVATIAGGSIGHRAAAHASRLAEQFIERNRHTFDAWAVRPTTRLSDSGGPGVLHLNIGSRIGAMPLVSPRSGRVEHGLIIRPRFGWEGIGDLLSATGATIMPELPAVPALPDSEHRVPPWVLASVVLRRIEALLPLLTRHYVDRRDVLDRPRGRVMWSSYIREHVGVGHPERVPCAFGDLRDDERWLAAAHATVLLQQRSLATVRRDGRIVRRLLAGFERLRVQLQHVPPRWDGLLTASASLVSETLVRALAAMQWTQGRRGLAGTQPTGGLAWRLAMEQVFEAWVERLARSLARRIGGAVRAGRQRETLHALHWQPPYSGSQRFLLPDVVIEGADTSIIIDAKYKSHWEELDASSWFAMRAEARESHRADLLQVLAYGAAHASPRVVCMLVYPCQEDTWRSLCERRRQFHVADVPAGPRNLRLVLAAVPLAGDPDAIVGPMIEALAA